MRREDEDKARKLDEWVNKIAGAPLAMGRPLVVDLPIEPVRPMASAWKFCLVATAALLAVSALLIAALGIRGLRLMTSGQIVAFVLIGMLALAATARLFYQEWKPGSAVIIRRAWAMALVAFGAGGFLALGFAFRPDWPHFITSGIVCLSIGTAASLVTGWLLHRLARSGFAVNERSASWANGILATLAGWMVLQIYCPKQEMAHLATWHGAALVTGTLAVAALVRRGSTASNEPSHR